MCVWILSSLSLKKNIISHRYINHILVEKIKRKREKAKKKDDEEKRVEKKTKDDDDDLIKKKKKQKKETPQLFVHAPRKSTECARHTWRGVLSSFRKNAVLLSPTRETDGDGEREREKEREKSARTHAHSH